MILLSIPLVIVFGMLGGQINKLFRPIGITLSIIGCYFINPNHVWQCILPTLLYGFILTLGYGPNSKLDKWLKDEDLVLDVYSYLLCLPLILTILLTGNIIAGLGILLILAAFQLRLGSWGKIGKYDVLGNDFFRWGAVGISMAIALL